MTWNYAYTPQIWPSAITALALIALAVYSLRRRNVPGVLPFSLALLLGALWIVGTGMEALAVNATDKIFWIKFQTACLLPAGTGITTFILEYSWPGHWLTRRNLVLLSIFPLLFLGLILTNDLHHWMWRGFENNGTVIPLLGAGHWILLAYAYGLAIINIIVFGWLFKHSPQHRWPVVLMLAGQIVARLVIGLGAAQVIQSNIPSQVIAVWFPYPMYVIALFGFRIFDPIPLARQTVIEQLRDGMLVLDPQGRLVSLNPAAEKILGASIKYVQGKSIGELLPSFAEPGSLLTGATAPSKPLEMNISLRGEVRCYELEYSPLHDFRGLPIGHLLFLHDVTEQRRSQVQILEQQRVLATLNEREQLARELHDGLGQELAAAHLLASTAKVMLERGETNQVGECLNNLADTTLQAEADMREYLLGAQSIVSAEQSFLTALREYQKRFTRQYSLPVELSLPPELAGQDLPQSVAVQLLRIIQEGLSNIRKHAHARCAYVSLMATGGTLQVVISDDGQGFDPSTVATQPGSGFGLRSMRERAEALGGALQIDSAPGKGTRLVVEVPVEERHGEVVMGRFGEKDGNQIREEGANYA